MILPFELTLQHIVLTNTDNSKLTLRHTFDKITTYCHLFSWDLVSIWRNKTGGSYCVLLLFRYWCGLGWWFKNTYELVSNPGAILLLNNLYIFQCMGKDILCGISKDTFEITHLLSYQYIERCKFYAMLKIWKLPNLRVRERFWIAPWSIVPSRPAFKQQNTIVSVARQVFLPN